MIKSNNFQGISWMLISCFWAACMGGMIRFAADEGMSTYEVVFYRSISSLVLLLPWFFKNGGVKVIRTQRLKLYVIRAVVGLVAMYFWFYSLMNIPLSDATALSFTVPLFTSLLAFLILKERIGIHRISALFIGFLGVLIVVRPGAEALELGALSAIVAAVFWAATSIMIKSLTGTDAPRVVVFYMALMMTPLSFPLALPDLEMITIDLFVWMLVMGLLSNAFQISLANSFAATELTVIMPFDFMRLVFVSIIAYLVFGESVDVWTYLGGAVIMCGAVYAAYRESIHAKRTK